MLVIMTNLTNPDSTSECRSECLNELISIGTCGLHTVSRAFQNAENSTNWNIKIVLSVMRKTFPESPSRRADYEKG